MSQLIALDDNNLVTQSTCNRCGYVWSFPTRYLHGRNYDHTLCGNCKASPQLTVKRDGIVCKPWDGDIDLDSMQPIDDDGKPYMPGIRTCGNSDCVFRSHVITTDQLIAELHSISYRTGKTLTYEALLKQLKKEANE